ncbi:hypothetical protein [Thalassospira xiamenensis]|uniref:hypothetical protein n=1 Tax=Thalassospira xiamenensis TaxID=220697 RepID=UPI0012E77B2B|nr:hypothetical protein [Thalassospira xiamenensis]
MADTQIPPSITGLSESPNALSARWQRILPADPHQPIPATRPADPVPIQSGHNSGPLILGIVTLHRPDWPRTELDRTNFAPALAALNKSPYPKGTTLPS